MSFKIFTLQLFGGLKSIEAIEKKRKELLDEYIEFQKVDSSAELQRYYELEKEISSEQFKRKKTEIEKLRFKGSNEHKQFLELKKLQKNKAIKKYMAVTVSNEFKRFEKLESSDKIKGFLILENESAGKEEKLKELFSDPDVKFYLKYKKSSSYKVFLQVHGSADLKRLNELKEITGTEEFKSRKTYLEDKKKWDKSEENKRLQEFLELKKQSRFVKYFKNKGTSAFKFFNEWQVVFKDDFDNQSFDLEKWATKGYVAEKLLGENYSLPGDYHVLTDGKNIHLNGALSIQVKKEKTSGKVWQMPAGFIPAELDYTSGLISSWKSFWMEDGILEAKIKFNPANNIVSSFYLAGENELPRVNLLEMGAKNRLGILSVNGSGKADVNGIDISNLKKGKWYIFAIEKQGQKYTWKINDAEIFNVNSSVLKDKLHVIASSIEVDGLTLAQLPAGFEIKWVRCYRKKQVAEAN